MAQLAYFAYGTTQAGFPHHRRMAELLGPPAGRFRTADPHAVVVPREPACSNPGCQLVHRMAMLVPALGELCAEGDVILISPAALARIDALEGGADGPYERVQVALEAADGGARLAAQAYRAREPARWCALVAAGGADALAAYPRELAADERLKECCRRDPGHEPPHDVLDPLAGSTPARLQR